MWAQGELSVDGAEFNSKTRFTLQKGDEANPIPTSLGDVRTATDGISQVTMSSESLRAGRTAMLLLDGTQPETTAFGFNLWTAETLKRFRFLLTYYRKHILKYHRRAISIASSVVNKITVESEG